MRFSTKLLIGLTLCCLLILLAGYFEESRMGLEGRYFTNPRWKGEAVAVQRDAVPELQRPRGRNITGTSKYSVVWTGWILLDKAGIYGFATNSDDGSTLWIDGKLVVDNGGMHGLTKVSNQIMLEKGTHKIEIRYVQYGGYSVLRTFWTPPDHPEERLPGELLFPYQPQPYFGEMQLRKTVRYRAAIILLLGIVYLSVLMWRGVHDIREQRATFAAKSIQLSTQLLQWLTRPFYKLAQTLQQGMDSPLWEQPQWSTLLLFSVYGLFVCIRLFEFSFVKEPFIWGDEYVYRILSYRYWTTGDFYASADTLHNGVKAMPNLLYPFLISWFSAYESSFFILMKIFNVLVMNAAIFPFFLLFKQFTSRKEALWLASLLLLIPWMNVGNFMMVEPLFFLFFWISFYCCYTFFVTPTLKNSLLAGGMIALTYATKPTAMGILAACFGVMVLLILRKALSMKARLRIVGFSGLMAIASIIGVMVINFLLKGQLDLGLGFYQVYAKGMAKNSFLQSLLGSIDAMRMIVTHVSIVFFLFLIPIVVISIALFQSRKQPDPRSYIFLSLGALLCLAFLGITIKFTLGLEVESELGRLHTRYYFMTFPFYVMAFVLFLKKISWGLPGRIIFGGLSVATLLWNYFVFLPKFAYLQGHPMIVDNMTYSWVYITQKIPFVVTAIALLNIAVCLYYLVAKKQTRVPYVLFFIIFCVIANYYQIQFMRRAGQPSEDFKKYKTFLASHIPDFSSKVVFIENFWRHSPYKTYTDLLNVLFWLPYDVVEHRDHPIGNTIEEKHISKDAEYVILTAEYDVKFQYQERWTHENYTILKR